MLALGAALVVYVWKWRPLLAVHIAILGIGIGLAVIGGKGHADSLGQRLGLWQDTIYGLTFWGHGIGSYYLTFPEYAEHINTLVSRPENAHNDYLEYIYELGIGTIPLAYLVGIAWRGNSGPERYMLVGQLAISAFGFPIHMPMGQFMAALILGSCCGGWIPLRGSIAMGRIRVFARIAAVKDSLRSYRTSWKDPEILPGISPVRTGGGELLRRYPLEGIGSIGNPGH